jgi:hypothetical protein
VNQKQIPISPGDKPKGDTPDLMQRTLPVKPQTADTLSKLDALLESEIKNKKRQTPLTPKCCGILPCKGRTIFCYQCDICLDCITGCGCGHSDSRHSFSNTSTDEEPDV